MAPSTQVEGGKVQQGAAAAAGAGGRLRRGRRGRSGGEEIDRPAPHPANASASMRFMLGGDAAAETRDNKLGGSRRARLRMGSGGADDSTPLGLIVVGGSGCGRRSPLIGDGGHGHRATVRGGGVAPPASRRSSAITDRTRGTRRPASSRRPEPARRHRGAAVAGRTTLRPRAPPPVREQRARGRKEREREEKKREGADVVSMTCGAHVGPTLSQPPPHIQPNGLTITTTSATAPTTISSARGGLALHASEKKHARMHRSRLRPFGCSISR
uniref:Uncharacterized protein n=1 Tax=Oryza sativa subsp. japonica TaxID=39947 RepID=Q8H597_ORYSJ|nr:hypothetical protein [Oryza sativa Japonica Group]